MDRGAKVRACVHCGARGEHLIETTQELVGKTRTYRTVLLSCPKNDARCLTFRARIRRALARKHKPKVVSTTRPLDIENPFLGVRLPAMVRSVYKGPRHGCWPGKACEQVGCSRHVAVVTKKRGTRHRVKLPKQHTAVATHA